MVYRIIPQLARPVRFCFAATSNTDLNISTIMPQNNLRRSHNNLKQILLRLNSNQIFKIRASSCLWRFCDCLGLYNKTGCKSEKIGFPRSTGLVGLFFLGGPSPDQVDRIWFPCISIGLVGFVFLSIAYVVLPVPSFYAHYPWDFFQSGRGGVEPGSVRN